MRESENITRVLESGGGSLPTASNWPSLCAYFHIFFVVKQQQFELPT
jgi:hypothetical protein